MNGRGVKGTVEYRRPARGEDMPRKPLDASEVTPRFGRGCRTRPKAAPCTPAYPARVGGFQGGQSTPWVQIESPEGAHFERSDRLRGLPSEARQGGQFAPPFRDRE